MISEAVAERARELLDGRLFLIPGDPPGAVVNGRSGTYRVWFDQEGVSCTCFAGSASWEVDCSHKAAAMVAWAEISRAVTEPIAVANEGKVEDGGSPTA